MMCPKCKIDMIGYSGPKKQPRLAGIIYEPEYSSYIEADGIRILSNEMFRIGENYLQARFVSLWGHPANDICSFAFHRRQALKAIKGCKVVMLFGASVVDEILGEGISGILGLKRRSPELPGSTLIAVPLPGPAVHKPLGEFRLCLERVAKELKSR